MKRLITIITLLTFNVFARPIECEDERVKLLLEQEGFKYEKITSFKIIEQTNWETKCEMENDKNFYELNIKKGEEGISIFVTKQ